jgi:hypothetical protein
MKHFNIRVIYESNIIIKIGLVIMVIGAVVLFIAGLFDVLRGGK